MIMKNSKILTTAAVVLLFWGFKLKAETLFEVKDALNNPVLNVSTDGLRIMNEGDTLMVISSDAIRANIGVTNKGLSRSFSVTTASSKGKGLSRVMEVGTQSTTLREGQLGQRYSNFSPENIFLGLKAGQQNHTGVNNIFIGNESGTFNYYGDDNIYIGYQAGYRNDWASENIFIGNYSGYNNDTDDPFPYGSMNVFVGTYSGYSNIDGYVNTFLGYRAGEDNRGASENTYVGGYAGSSNNGSRNASLGVSALGGNTSGAQNTAIGTYSGLNNLTGSRNVFLGYSAGYNETGSDKLYIANTNTSTPLIKGTFPNADLTFTANAITATGNYFRMSNDPGSGSVPANYFYQGSTASTSKQFAFTIYDALWVTSHSWLEGQIYAPAVYNSIVGATYRDLYIDNTGKMGYLSSALKYKKNVKNIDDISWLFRLRPVNYDYISNDSGKTEYGLIAEEVEKVNRDFVSYNESGLPETVSYSQLITPMLKAIQEQQKMIEELKKEIEMLKNK
jgi:hypothetical protein